MQICTEALKPAFKRRRFKKSRSNLQHECMTRATQAQYERHKCNTSATLATRVKNFDFDNDMGKNIFSQPYINCMAS